MSKATHEILDALAEYEQTEACAGLDLRLSLAELIIRRLQELGWSQRIFAQKTGLKESFISRVLHSNANCTLGTAGRMLFALGIGAEFQQMSTAGRSDVVDGAGNDTTTATPNSLRIVRKDGTYGKEIEIRATAQATASIAGYDYSSGSSSGPHSKRSTGLG